MSFRRIAPKPAGFTLVELLIVVIIIAILAAVVVPQFSDTGTQARESALDANLATMRSAIELYQQQHGDYPGAKASTSGGTANSEAAFVQQLTLYSSAAGLTSSTKTETFKYGPYLRKGIPAEPVSGVATVAISTDGALNMAASADPGPGGWRFNTVTGQLIANTTKYQAK